jgi:GxxExxY protein
LHGRITDAVLASFYSIHTELGYGFLEGVYNNALAVMLCATGLRVEREVPFEIWFHGHSIGQYRAEVGEKVIAEVKSGRTIAVTHTKQVLNYLRASGLEVGLLLNFGQLPEFKRVVSTRNAPRPSA